MKANRRVRDLARRVKKYFTKPVVIAVEKPPVPDLAPKTPAEELELLFSQYKKKEKNV